MKKRTIKLLAMLLTMLLIITALPMSVSAGEVSLESTPIVSMSVDKTLASEGESIVVTFEMEDEFEAESINYFKPITQNIVSYKFEKVANNMYCATIDVDDQYENGIWEVSYFSYFDKNGDFQHYYDSSMSFSEDTVDFASIEFEITGTNADVTPPILVDYAIDKTLVSLNESVSFTVILDEERPDDDIYLHYQKPNGEIELFVLNKISDTLTYKGTFDITENTIAGVWKLKCFSVDDANGNQEFIYNKEVSLQDDAQDFSSLDFEVVGTSADITPPFVKSLSVNKNIVSAGESILMSGEVEEENPKSTASFWYKTPSGENEIIYLNNGSDPCLYTKSYYIDHAAEIGMWQLYRIDFSDTNDNKYYVYNSNATSMTSNVEDLSYLDFEVVKSDKPLETEPTEPIEPSKPTEDTKPSEPPVTEPTENTNPISYLVIFKDGFGTTLSTQRVNHGESAVEPKTPTNELYLFDSWDCDFTNVTSDLTVTAQWIVNPNVEYDYEVAVGEPFEIEVYSTVSQSFTVTCNSNIEFTYSHSSTGTIFSDKLYYSNGYEIIVDEPGVYLFYVKGSRSSNTLTYKVKVNAPYEDYEGITSDGLKYTVVDKKVEILDIVDYFDANTELNIPSSIDGYPVTKIGYQAFAGCKCKSITIPNTVVAIDDFAFSGCFNLENITIPNSVTSIGWSAFANCTSITTITIPESVNSIDYTVFNHCDNLKEINVDAGNLNYSSIDGVLFNMSATEIIQYPNGKESSEYVLPDCVEKIGDYSFSDNAYLLTVVLPDGVTYIGASAFYNCSSLTSITIPNGVTDINNNTFNSCSSLESVTIPSAMANVDVSAFKNCLNLSNVYYDGTEEQWSQVVIAENNNELLNANIHYSEVDVVYEEGDVDLDGRITIKDATEIQRHLAQLTTLNETALSVADTDNDGRVAITDATRIQKFLAQLITEL